MSTRTGSSASSPTPGASKELPLLSSNDESWQLSDASYHGFNPHTQPFSLSSYRGGEVTSPVGSGDYSQHYAFQYIHDPDSISPTMSSPSAFSVVPGARSTGNSLDYLTGPLSAGASESTSSDLDEMFGYCAVENQHPQIHREYTDNTTRLTLAFPQLHYVDTSVAQYKTDEPMSPSTGSSSAAHYHPGIMPASPQGSVSPTQQRLFSPGSSPFKRSDSAAPQIQRQMNQLQVFKSIPEQAIAMTMSGPFIPQKPYRPHTSADKKRYVEQIQLEDPIIFDCESPYEWGIPLKDALLSSVKRMVNRDDTVFQQRGPSVSIRIEWPGYGSWSRQIPTKDFKSPPGPITRQKLAKNIAKNVERFLKYAQDQIMDEDAEQKWRVSPNHIKFDDLVLVSLHHVSMGSWQPHLRLKTPFAAVGR